MMGKSTAGKVLLCFLVLAACVPALAGDAPEGDIHKIFRWRPFLAPFHAVVLHFPIGFLTVVCILELYGLKHPGRELRRISRLFIWLSLVTGIMSATFGILRSETGGYESHALQLHRACGLGVPVFTLATLAFQMFADRQTAVRGWNYAYFLSLTVTLILVVIAGHFGGNLTHGSKYLTENAPAFVRELVENDTPGNPSNHAVAKLDEAKQFYAEKIQPIFAAKCYSCHGPEKQKSGYRLDQIGLAFKSGKSGKTAIKSGDPIESHLVRLILLPPHHDDVMPPDGKQPLALEEIMAIIDWIRNGAVTPDAPAAAGNADIQN